MSEISCEEEFFQKARRYFAREGLEWNRRNYVTLYLYPLWPDGYNGWDEDMELDQMPPEFRLDPAPDHVLPTEH